MAIILPILSEARLVTLLLLLDVPDQIQKPNASSQCHTEAAAGWVGWC